MKNLRPLPTRMILRVSSFKVFKEFIELSAVWELKYINDFFSKGIENIHIIYYYCSRIIVTIDFVVLLVSSASVFYCNYLHYFFSFQSLNLNSSFYFPEKNWIAQTTLQEKTLKVIVAQVRIIILEYFQNDCSAHDEGLKNSIFFLWIILKNSWSNFFKIFTHDSSKWASVTLWF